MSENSIHTTADAGNAPNEIKEFAERMAAAQGCRVVLASEASGYHLYLPCPDCLDTHGSRELQDPKYAINVSKYLGIGDGYRGLTIAAESLDPTVMEASFQVSETRDRKSGICMRTRQSKNPHRFSVRELLGMTTITHRHPDIHTAAEVFGQAGSADRESHWEADPATGVMCPPPPGEVVPITSLPPEHPAAQYLTNRGYDLQRLWQQFRCSFCTEEYPEGKNDIYYRKMPGGWRDTPQHRVIFYSLVDGVPMTWQARYPERISSDGLNRFMLHPYDTTRSVTPGGDRTFCWSHTHTRANPQTSWIPVPPFDETMEDGTLRFQPSKYRTAKYSQREMMGWDAAIERADADPDMLRWVVLCEGPLDAARVGPGGVALIGSSISPVNATKVAANFSVVFTAFDNDLAGTAATEKIGRMILGGSQRNLVTQLVVPLPVEGGKDIGDMSQEAFNALLQKSIRRAQRGL